MHELQIAYDEDAELRAQIAGLQEGIARNPLQHGLVLDLNPFWDFSRRLDAAGIKSEAAWDILFGHVGLPTFDLPSPGRAELNRHYPDADRLSERTFGKRERQGPFLLRILAAPSLTREDAEMRYALAAAARSAALPTIVETEDQAHLVHQSGSRIDTPQSFGTLGGFVRDQPSGANYAMTCGHVISTGQAASTFMGPLGDCEHHTAPIPATPDASGATPDHLITRNDIALIRLPGATPKNRATSIRAILNRSDRVEMAGGTSGLRQYEVGGLMLNLRLAGSVWENLILLQAPTQGVFPQIFRDWSHPRPVEGDSGAWIYHEGSAWGGMVVASSPQFGYAVPATKALEDANQRFGLDLALA